MQHQEREQKAAGRGNDLIEKTESSACCVLSASAEEYARASPYLAEVFISGLLAANTSVYETQDSRLKTQKGKGKREEGREKRDSLLPFLCLASCVLCLVSSTSVWMRYDQPAC